MTRQKNDFRSIKNLVRKMFASYLSVLRILEINTVIRKQFLILDPVVKNHCKSLQ